MDFYPARIMNSLEKREPKLLQPDGFSDWLKKGCHDVVKIDGLPLGFEIPKNLSLNNILGSETGVFSDRIVTFRSTYFKNGKISDTEFEYEQELGLFNHERLKEHPTKSINVLMNEISSTKLGEKINPGDLANADILKKLPSGFLEATHKYLGFSMKGSHTEYHLDDGGVSTLLYMIEGKKRIYVVPTSEDILRDFTDFAVSQDYQNICYTKHRNGFYFDIEAGQSFFLPSGTPHSVDTLVDSLFLMTSILSKYHLPLSLAILELIEMSGEGQEVLEILNSSYDNLKYAYIYYLGSLLSDVFDVSLLGKKPHKCHTDCTKNTPEPNTNVIRNIVSAERVGLKCIKDYLDSNGDRPFLKDLLKNVVCKSRYLFLLEKLVSMFERIPCLLDEMPVAVVVVDGNMEISEEKIFRCTYEDCSTKYSSSKKSNVDRHIRMVHERKTENCDLCGASISLGNMKRHLETCPKNGSRPRFDCDVCGESFSRKDRLAAHEKKH